MHNISERSLFWFNFKLHWKSLWNSARMPVFRFILFPWVCMNARGLGGLLIYLRLSSFSSLNPFSKACATPPTKGNLFKKYLCEEERNILETERKVLYPVTHKHSKIPVPWQGKYFYFFFIFLSINLLISVLVVCFRDHIAIFLDSLIANGRVWFVQFFYFCKLVVSLILHILKQC